MRRFILCHITEAPVAKSSSAIGFSAGSDNAAISLTYHYVGYAWDVWLHPPIAFREVTPLNIVFMFLQLHENSRRSESFLEYGSSYLFADISKLSQSGGSGKHKFINYCGANWSENLVTDNICCHRLFNWILLGGSTTGYCVYVNKLKTLSSCIKTLRRSGLFSKEINCANLFTTVKLKPNLIYANFC